MARYINAYDFAEVIENLDITVAGKPARWNDAKYTVLKELAEAPTADVAPRAEVERLERILNSYVLQYGTAVDKQKIIDEAKIEVAREIIGEILSTNTPDVDGFFTIHETELTELKKKYTEGQK